jgi:hypothetical protein
MWRFLFVGSLIARRSWFVAETRRGADRLRAEAGSGPASASDPDRALSTFDDLNTRRNRGRMRGEEGWRHWN